MEQPPATNSGSLRVCTTALRFAEAYWHSAADNFSSRGVQQKWGKHSLTHLRATKVTSCIPYAPQPLSNSKEPNNAAPGVATRLKLQLREGSWSFFVGCCKGKSYQITSNLCLIIRHSAGAGAGQVKVQVQFILKAAVRFKIKG